MLIQFWTNWWSLMNLNESKMSKWSWRKLKMIKRLRIQVSRSSRRRNKSFWCDMTRIDHRPFNFRHFLHFSLIILEIKSFEVRELEYFELNKSQLKKWFEIKLPPEPYESELKLHWQEFERSLSSTDSVSEFDPLSENKIEFRFESW